MLDLEEPRRRLLDALEGIDRLVLLGDIVELMEGRARAALAAAAPVLRALGARLGAEGEVVLVPGNHDRPLIRSWIRRQNGDLARQGRVPLDASPALRSVCEQLAPARVEVRYPGAWLSDRVWGTHGHYLDRHLVPVSNWGRLRSGGEAVTRTTPWQHERPGRVHISPVMRWLPGSVASRIRATGAVVRATTMPALQETVLDPRIAPLTARLLSRQMERHALPALGRVVRDLGVETDWVVFGHVHRLGPLAGDSELDWSDPEGGIRFANCGSWLYEPRLVHRVRPPHPYWPGGAVLLDPGRPPRAVGLLDDVPRELLHQSDARGN